METVFKPTNEELMEQWSQSFAREIIRIYQGLTVEKKDSVIWEQCLKCGTSIGANFCEGIYKLIHRKVEFADKLHKALEEAYETKYWLNLLCDTGYIPDRSILHNCKDLIDLITDLLNKYSYN